MKFLGIGIMFENTHYGSEEDDPTPEFVEEAIDLYVIKKIRHFIRLI